MRDAVAAADYEAACERLIAQFKTLHGSMRESVPSVEAFMAAHHMQCPMALNRLVKVGLPATIEHRKPAGEAGGGGGGARAVAETVQHFITAMDSLKLNLVAVDQVRRARVMGVMCVVCMRVCVFVLHGSAGLVAHSAAWRRRPESPRAAAPSSLAPPPRLIPPRPRPPAPPPATAAAAPNPQICPILSDLISSMSKIATLPPEFGPKAKAKGWYSRLYAQPASYELGEAEVRQLLFDLESSYNEFISTIK